MTKEIEFEGRIGAVVQQLVADLNAARDWSRDVNLAVARAAQGMAGCSTSDVAEHADAYCGAILDAREAVCARLGNPHPAECTWEWLGTPSPAPGFTDEDMSANGAVSALVESIYQISDGYFRDSEFSYLVERCMAAA